MSADPSDPVARLRSWFATHDPDVLAAVDDVDRTLIRSSLEQTPFERLDRALNAGASWAFRWTDDEPRGPSAR